jgi:hypothetical protein
MKDPYWYVAGLPEKGQFDHLPGMAGVEQEIDDTTATEAAQNLESTFRVLKENLLTYDIVKKANISGLKKSPT